MKINPVVFQELENNISGDLRIDDLHQKLYATDASIYKENPLGVVYPRDTSDIREIVLWAQKHHISLIPRAAGTSLAGQCVGSGLVVDVSLYMTKILEVNQEEKWVRVQPGVIRDELNNFLQPLGLYFGPNTSTANRCMIGGMVGNNSCGSTSIEFGNTRDHVLEMEVVLSDGRVHTFKEEKYQTADVDGNTSDKVQSIYSFFDQLLSDKETQDKIIAAYPHQEIKRRNQGYALDALLAMRPFDAQSSHGLNLSKLLCGSEGTLAFTTEIKLNLVDLPSSHVAVLCAHFSSIAEAMESTVLSMQHQPSKCELMDRTILHCAKTNPDQLKNMFFVEGDPEALLTVEFRGQNDEEALVKAEALARDLQIKEMGYAFPIVLGVETNKIWELRAAGLGVLSNVKGDAKPIACIEDTAVRIEDLPAYIAEFEEICQQHHQKAVFYAHAGAGELHLRPILNLKDPKDVKGLRAISTASAALVKKYRGVLSGEHGDGRLRGEFLPFMVGDEVYQMWKEIKRVWDPNNIFNPGKIVDAPPMDEQLRYTTREPEWEANTVFDFSESGGMMRAIEKCNGTGDCRRIAESGGTMCPSYMASRQEKDTTRGRANAMREYMKGNGKAVSFQDPEVMEVLDLCLSCKGCSSECPSNVDMARLKSEYTFQYYQHHRRKWRDYLVLHFYRLYKWGHIWPGLTNFMIKYFGASIKNLAGFASGRSLPLVEKKSWRQFLHKNHQQGRARQSKTVYLFVDEFIDLNESKLGIQTTQLLRALGYQVSYVPHNESGRAAFSKGFLRTAKRLAEENVRRFANVLKEDAVLVGVEPSAILSFRDEYPNILSGDLRTQAIKIKQHTYTIEEFLWSEYQSGAITTDDFDTKERWIKLHLHCHFKSLSEKQIPVNVLSIPAGNHVEYIASGCCGMAGSFGFEKEHFALSQQVANLVLFPNIQSADQKYLIAAQGVSCRHQIKDGLDKEALHPVEILYEAVKKEI